MILWHVRKSHSKMFWHGSAYEKQQADMSKLFTKNPDF